MPTITDINLQLTVADITNAWGPRSETLATPTMLERLSDLLTQIESNRWLDAAINYQILEITDSDSAWIGLGDAKINSPLVAHRLRRATHLAFGVCTLGEKLLQQVSRRFDEKEQLQAVILDEIGTLLLYKLSGHFEDLMCEQAIFMGLQASGTLSPGDDGFDIRQQGTVLGLAGGKDIGVTLMGAGMLVPKNSLTTVIGLGEHMPTWSIGESCARCKSRERCPHRQDLNAGVAA